MALFFVLPYVLTDWLLLHYIHLTAIFTGQPG